jgi:hypothetical protein
MMCVEGRRNSRDKWGIDLLRDLLKDNGVLTTVEDILGRLLFITDELIEY